MSDPLGELSQGFALSFVLVILLRIIMHLRVLGEHSEYRPLISKYILGDIPLALIWLVSAFTPPPIRFWLWGGGIIWGFSVPLLPQMRLWGEKARPNLHHLSERVGLFTIIVLGESFIKIVVGTFGSEHHSLGLPGALGMFIVASLWWTYFDHSNATEVDETPMARFIWFFSHLPFAIGAIIVGVALKQVVLAGSTHSADGGATWLVGALGLCWSILALWELVSSPKSAVKRSSLPIGRFVGALLLFIFGIMGGDLGAEWALIFAVLVCSVMVLQDIFWQRQRSTEASR